MADGGIGPDASPGAPRAAPGGADDEFQEATVFDPNLSGDTPAFVEEVSAVEMELEPPPAEYPRLRKDLVIEDTRKGRVVVRRPESQQSFPIYKLEWDTAQLFDGSRTVQDVAKALGQKGQDGSLKLVQSFLRELKGYGFLDTPASGPVRKARPRSASSVSQEVNQLVASAIAFEERGDFGNAAEYLRAALEIEPENASARELLQGLPTMVPRGSTSMDLDFLRDSQDLSVPAAPVLKSVPDVAPAPVEASPAAAGTLSFRQVVLLLLLFSGCVVALVMVGLTWLKQGETKAARPPVAAATPAAKPTATPPPSPEAAAPAAQTAPAATTLRLNFQPQKEATLTAKRSGEVRELRAKPGQFVEAGVVLLTIIDPKAERAASKAKRKYEKLAARARKSPVYQDFALAARSEWKKARRRRNRVRVKSPSPGRVFDIKVRSGRRVRKNAPLLLVLDDRVLLSEPIVSAGDGFGACEIPGAAGASCRVERDAGGKQRVRITRGASELDWREGMEVKLYPAGSEPPEAAPAAP